MTTAANHSTQPDRHAVRNFLLGWQKELCSQLELLQQQLFPDAPQTPFRFDHWQRNSSATVAAAVAQAQGGTSTSQPPQREGLGAAQAQAQGGSATVAATASAAQTGAGLCGEGISAVASGGVLWEKAGVNFSHVSGASLPPSASARHPHLAGRTFEAMGVSIVIHPLNPYVPTTHANIRFLSTTPKDTAGVTNEVAGATNEATDSTSEAGSADPLWWFGGGFDLTPFYGFDEDAVHWHSTAKAACEPFGKELYPKYKDWCDRYFYLPHRNEPRGIGGLFFDDTTCDGDFNAAFALARSVAQALFAAYAPIVERRARTPYTEHERNWQLYRRGRYVEFNLICDRGTHFGLQSRGRTESILMSMPPLARWEYDYHPQPGSSEARLLEHFLQPRDWLHTDNAAG